MSKGFTIFETIIAIAIFTIISTAVFSIISHIYRTYSFNLQITQAISEARRGMKVMLREIRAADTGEDGSFTIETANATEFTFYSDIDRDGEIERVRYFLGTSGAGEQELDCASFSRGGSCSVIFSDFFENELESASIQIGVEGDLGWHREIVDITVDGNELTESCYSGCNDCAGEWQDVDVFDVTEHALDNELVFVADSSVQVDAFCDWQQNNHSILANFNLTWIATALGEDRNLKKGVIHPVNNTYSVENEEITIVSSSVENISSGLQDYIFRYFDQDGNHIENPVQRIEQTQLMEISLYIDINPEAPPKYYRLETSAQLRNLKKEE